jgi:hypothetical protein
MQGTSPEQIIFGKRAICNHAWASNQKNINARGGDTGSNQKGIIPGTPQNLIQMSS